MNMIQLALDIGVCVLLAITLVQAVRLERALVVVRTTRDRLAPLVEEFDSSTRQAETAIARLHDAAENAGRQVGRQTDAATALKDDLAFLVERGDRLADRIQGLVRNARPLASPRPSVVPEPAVASPGPRLVSDRAAEMAPLSPPVTATRPLPEAIPAIQPRPLRTPRVRSQAERDLLKALRVAR